MASPCIRPASIRRSPSCMARRGPWPSAWLRGCLRRWSRSASRSLTSSLFASSPAAGAGSGSSACVRLVAYEIAGGNVNILMAAALVAGARGHMGPVAAVRAWPSSRRPSMVAVPRGDWRRFLAWCGVLAGGHACRGGSLVAGVGRGSFAVAASALRPPVRSPSGSCRVFPLAVACLCAPSPVVDGAGRDPLLPVLWWGSLVLLVAPLRLWLDDRDPRRRRRRRAGFARERVQETSHRSCWRLRASSFDSRLRLSSRRPWPRGPLVPLPARTTHAYWAQHDSSPRLLVPRPADRRRRPARVGLLLGAVRVAIRPRLGRCGRARSSPSPWVSSCSTRRPGSPS